MFLYAAYLGGPLGDGRMGEDHEVVLVVAGDAAEARRQARAKWSGVGRPHVDAVQRISVVDGHRVAVTPAADASGDVFELEGYNE
jgi:hypothetical protein